MEPMFCKRCGKPVDAGSQWCGACGAPLTPQNDAGTTTDGQPFTKPLQQDPQGQTTHGEPPQGKSPLGNLTKRQLTIIAGVVVAVIVVIALIVGVTTWRHSQSGTSSATASSTRSASATTSPRKSSTPKPTVSSTPQVSSVTMASVMCDGRAVDVRWNWTGGALASNPLACYSDANLTNGILTFGLWTPAMTQSKQFTVTLAQSGEKLESKGDDFIQIAATYGDKPDVFLVYEIKTKAVGTTPESVHAYASQLDVETGKLGERIDLSVTPDDAGNIEQGPSYNFVASSDIAIVIDRSWTTKSENSNENASTSHHQVLRLYDGKTTVLQTFEKTDSQSSRIGVTASGADDLYLVNDRLFSIEENKEIGTLSCIPDSFTGNCGGYGTIRKLSDTHYAYRTDFAGAYIFNASDGTTRRMEDVLGLERRENSIYYYDNVTDWEQFSDRSLYIRTSSNRMFCMAPDLSVTEILNEEQWNRLLSGEEFKGVNYLNKTIYVQTTDERIAVDMQGQSVGRYTAYPRGSSNYGTFPDPTATK